MEMKLSDPGMPYPQSGEGDSKAGGAVKRTAGIQDYLTLTHKVFIAADSLKQKPVFEPNGGFFGLRAIKI
jgi:hypothetical protein